MDERFVRPAAILFSDGVSEQDEVVSSRRPNGKTFDLGGGRFRTRTALGAIHYKADPSSITEQWKPIDLAIDALGQVSAAPYTISISQTGIGYRYTSRRGGRIDVDLLQIDGEPVDVGRIRVRRDGNILFWNNAADGLDLKCQLRPAQAEVFKLLADAAAPRQFLWRVREDVRAECRFVRKTGGYDVDGDPLEVACTAFDEHTVTDEGRTYREFLYDERWTGRVSRRVDPKTRQRDWFDDPVYPCVVDATTQENIVADTDDGYEFDDNTWGYALNSWYAGQLGAWRLNSGTRFQSLGVPQGATINSATIKIKVGKIAGSPSVTVRSDDVDDAPAWSANSRPSQITQTTASTAVGPTATGTYTVNVAGIVQEIVNRASWASGNDIRFAWLGPVGGSADDYFYGYDYHQGQAGAAILDVDYTAGGVIGQMAGVAWASVGQLATVAEASIAKVAGVVAN